MNFILFSTALGIILKSTLLVNALITKPYIRNKRMVNGVKSTIEQFPYLVSLERSAKQLCGGSIISPLHILTAAHCLSHKNPKQYQVRAGSSLMERDGTLYRVKNFTIHKNYSEVDNDLAVIQLKEPIEFDSTKQPIDMFDFGEKSKPESMATAAGWGIAGYFARVFSGLKSVELNIVDEKMCRNIWKNDYERYHATAKLNGGKIINEGHICARDVGHSKSACNGDSGGPLVINGKLAGITSFTHFGCRSWPVPNVFTNVAYYRKWIDEQILESSKVLLKNESGPDKHFNIYLFSIIASVISIVIVAVFLIHCSTSFKIIACKIKWSRSPSKRGYETI